MSRKLNDGSTILLFGIDQMVKSDGADLNYIPQIQHEIFHLYHAQVSPALLDTKEMYAHLWQEGLAVYATRVLNPGATKMEIYLSNTLPDEAGGMVPKLAKEIHQKLYSTSREDDAGFFNMTTKRKDIPAKSGYYIGSLVAEELAKKYTLMELARLQGKPLTEEIEAVLTKMVSQ